MRNPIVAFMCALAVTGASAEERVAVDFRCLSGGSNNSIHLEWRTFIDVPTKWTTSYVRYKSSPMPIPLVLKYEEATQKPAGRPWEFTEVWLEVVEGKITGEYEVVSQGAMIYSFSYKNYRTGRVVDFGQDDGAFAEDGCQWH
jgi:hypothetical protein